MGDEEVAGTPAVGCSDGFGIGCLGGICMFALEFYNIFWVRGLTFGKYCVSRLLMDVLKYLFLSELLEIIRLAEGEGGCSYVGPVTFINSTVAYRAF